MEKPPQQLIIGRVVSGIDGLVVLAEELLALWLGEVTEDLPGMAARLGDYPAAAEFSTVHTIGD